MPKAWKVAPGEDAHAWPACREWRCIVIGWHEIGNHDRFGSLDAIRKEMKRVYRRGEPGTGPRGARSVWRFVRELQRKDVVVANEGRSRVVGIGVVRSTYLRPGDPRNPSKHEWLKSARLVDWRITEPVQLGDYFFVQDTVWPLDLSQCEQIRHAYLRKHPGLKKELADLFSDVEPHVDLDHAETSRLFSRDSDIEGLRAEYRATRATRSRRLRNQALRMAGRRCAVCRRDFSKLLAGRGQRVLQVHHCDQLSARQAPSVTKLSDLAVVCANCHLLLHLDTGQTMTVNQLRGLLWSAGYLQR